MTITLLSQHFVRGILTNSVIVVFGSFCQNNIFLCGQNEGLSEDNN